MFNGPYSIFGILTFKEYFKDETRVWRVKCFLWQIFISLSIAQIYICLAELKKKSITVNKY